MHELPENQKKAAQRAAKKLIKGEREPTTEELIQLGNFLLLKTGREVKDIPQEVKEHWLAELARGNV